METETHGVAPPCSDTPSPRFNHDHVSGTPDPDLSPWPEPPLLHAHETSRSSASRGTVTSGTWYPSCPQRHLQRQRIVEVHPPGRERAFTNPASNPIQSDGTKHLLRNQVSRRDTVP